MQMLCLCLDGDILLIKLMIGTKKFIAEVGSNPAEPVLLQGYIPKGLKK